MKRLIILALLLQALLMGLQAASRIVALPSAELIKQSSQKQIYPAVRELSESGYGILHYNSAYVIAVTPPDQSTQTTGVKTLSAYPPARTLYLIGRIEGRPDPDWNRAGQMLLDLGTSVLLQSELDETGLRSMFDNPFTLLSLEPMRFPDTVMSPSASAAARTDIDTMLALVNTTSVQGLIQSLQDFQTRYAFADNRLQVAQWIQQQFISYGITNATLQSFSWQNTTQYNVVATIPGTVYPDQYIVVGGHHDSISGNSDPFTLAPGADDNASGSVAALEMARVMMASGYQPRTSIRFVTFAAEEFGLWGSKHYAQNALENAQNIRLMMNHDMIANQTSPGAWQVRLMPYDGSLEHSAYASQITEQYTDLETYYGNSNSGSSDSHPFWQRGYHVIYFFESDFSPVYHSAQDLVVNLNPAYCAEVIKASVACAATFADMPAAPYDLEIQDAGNGSTLVASWQGYNDPSIDHYNVYYSTVMGDWGTPDTTTQTSLAVGGLIQGQLYYFAVSAVDTFGNESYMIYSTGIPLTVPLEPQNFFDQPQFQSIALNWDANGELDLTGYQLFRSQSEGVLGDQIGGAITGNSYVDTAVVGSPAYYYYSLRAVDNDGNVSPFTQVVFSRPVTLDQGVLIVDETENMSGTNPFQPTDAQADDFYDSITTGVSTTQLDLNSLGRDLHLADIGIYSSILWHGNDQASMDYPYFVQDALMQYIQLGGNIMFSVYVPSMAFDLNSTYPRTFDPASFINGVIGIGEADYTATARFRFAIPVHDQFPPVSVDPDKTSPSLNGHILRVESIGPNPDCATIYNYGSDYESTAPQGVMNNMPIGVLNLNQSGKVCVVSFPLYNLYRDDAQDLVEYVMSEYFNETITAVDDPLDAPPALRILANYPNPFSGRTSFRVESISGTAPLRVEIYNLRGQLVRTLFAGSSPKSRLFEWDGRDGLQNLVAHGVYFVKASQGGAAVTRRMLLLH